MTEPIDPNVLPEYPPPPAYLPPAYLPPPTSQWPPTQWPPTQWPPTQWPATEWPPPPPPSHVRRNMLIALVVVVVLAAAGVGAYFVLRKSSSNTSRLALPTSFDGYSKLSNSEANSVTSMIRSVAGSAGGGRLGSMFDAAAIGVYGKDSGDQPSLIVFVLPTASLPSSAPHDPDSIASGLLTMAGAGRAFPAGRHGGALRCTTMQFGIASESLCAWSDSKTTGMMFSGRTQPDQLAQVANDLRDRVD